MSSVQAPLAVGGSRVSGNSVRSQNVMACNSIANVIRSSLGPVGLDKMLVDDIGDVQITNDGATILSLLEVEHPAAKILVDLAKLQDEEVGDGTTSVVLIASELLKNAEELVQNKIHPTSIMNGYLLACKEACKYVQENLTVTVDSLGKECIINAARTSMSSKLVSTDTDFFSKLVVDAVTAVKQTDSRGFPVYPVKSIQVLKATGKSPLESQLVNGFALNCTVAHQQMVKHVKNAKIAFLDFSLQRAKMSLGVHVLINDPDKLEAIRERESLIPRERIQKIIAAGANVILTTGGIDDLCNKYFIENGILAVTRCLKMDLKRIAKATGGQLLSSLANMEGGESFDAADLGEAEEVAQERVSDNELILIKNPKSNNLASIILRGPNEYFLDEAHRSVHDAICVVKRVLETKKLVPGGGAVEAALSIYLESFATSLSSIEQLAIAEFAKSLLVVPKTLAVNAAKDATDLVAKLRSYHNSSQTKAEHANLKWVGLDLNNGTVRDNKEAGVLEPAMSKIKSLKYATEAAITILRIDDLIKIEAKPDEKQQYDQCGAGDY